MSPALILGGGRGVLREAAPFLDKAAVFAVNRTGLFTPVLHHWVSIHGETLERLAFVRRHHWDEGRFVPAIDGIGFHSAKRPVPLPDWIRTWDFVEAGTSSLFAALVALDLGFAPVVICGVPLTNEPGEYDTPFPERIKYANSRPAWDCLKGDPRIRATAGYTRELFGPPEEGFI